ncbi:phage tail protein [Nitrolancea hollandica]|uniref:Phage Tail Collar n=1 Tax=Nitrolancea hollandica Lb TaxID=1129897 RepID=I4EE51_9BACT|nr:tail fiber protein [Nitrolancea hollandica]CCF82963.1 Phage Tail Collar [Nitrolancea hollandica Lb]
MSEPFLGEVRMVAFSFAPRGWALCDGQLLPINQNQALFSLLGTVYGGDGVRTFALPDLRGRTPVHADTGHPLGQASGAETHTLVPAETPSHTHSVRAAAATAASPNPSGDLLAKPATPIYGPAKNLLNLLPGTVSMNGGQAHENMQPYLVVNFAIALSGIYPTPN